MQAEVIFTQKEGLFGHPMQSPTLSLKIEGGSLEKVDDALERVFWHRVDPDNINYYADVEAYVATTNKVYLFRRTSGGIFKPDSWRMIEESS